MHIQHGLLGSSTDFVLNGPQNSLPMILADAGETREGALKAEGIFMGRKSRVDSDAWQGNRVVVFRAGRVARWNVHLRLGCLLHIVKAAGQCATNEPCAGMQR